MNKRTFLPPLALAASLLLSTPASAGVLYDNGPISGKSGPGAFSIYAGWNVADSFTLTETSTLTGVTAGLWTNRSATPALLTWAISEAPDYGGSHGFGVGVLTSSLFCSGCGVGASFDVHSSSFSLPNIVLGPGTYWLTLSDGQPATGDGPGLWWDDNNGPSVAWQSGTGPLADITIAERFYPGSNSESFQILGDTSGVPEPVSTALFVSGLAVVGALARRKMRA